MAGKTTATSTTATVASSPDEATNSSHPQHPVVSKQPLRVLFQLGSVASIIARLPVWATRALVPPLRPRPGWTAKQTFITPLFYSLVDMQSRIGITETTSFEPGVEGDHFAVAEPFPSKMYLGPLEPSPANGSTAPFKTGGVWYPRKPSCTTDTGLDPSSITKTSLVGLHVHGGAFVLGTGRSDFSGFAASTLTTHGGLDFVFCLTYRLSGYGGSNPFPAALQDTLTCYLYLTRTMGFPAQNVVVSGDSAGGNLIVALLRYIGEYGAKLEIELPRCAVLFSPWVSPMLCLADESVHGYTTCANKATDYLPMSFLKWGATTYRGALTEEEALDHPYITPSGHAFATPVRILINVGEAEIFDKHVAAWAEEMKAVEGNHVELNVEENAVHDSIVIGGQLGFEKSAREVAERIKGFVVA